MATMKTQRNLIYFYDSTVQLKDFSVLFLVLSYLNFSRFSKTQQNLFLLDYLDDDQMTILKDMILNFAIDQNSKPVNFYVWRNWASAAVKFNAKQTELINDLISINTPISTETAFKIIQAWLRYHKDLVGSEVVQQVSLNTQGMQQAIDEIKQQQRSYLLLDDEVTVLETYHIMLKLLKLQDLDIPEFVIDAEQGNKPKAFMILLEWIRICEQVIKA